MIRYLMCLLMLTSCEAPSLFGVLELNDPDDGGPWILPNDYVYTYIIMPDNDSELYVHNDYYKWVEEREKIKLNEK